MQLIAKMMNETTYANNVIADTMIAIANTVTIGGDRGARGATAPQMLTQPFQIFFVFISN